jgi:hypothetical protein
VRDQLAAEELPLRELWGHYQTLLREQDEVLAAQDDDAALRHELARFPSLRCVTITPAAHSIIPFQPLYENPMIRAFPRGFNYPPPYGWLVTAGAPPPHLVEPPWRQRSETYKAWWRGFLAAIRELACEPHAMDPLQHPHGVVELSVDARCFSPALTAASWRSRATSRRSSRPCCAAPGSADSTSRSPCAG